ncbi:MAG: hypothetical protein ACPGYL_07940, partial [Rhodospirillaceae bacterium]
MPNQSFIAAAKILLAKHRLLIRFFWIRNQNGFNESLHGDAWCHIKNYRRRRAIGMGMVKIALAVTPFDRAQGEPAAKTKI